MKRLIQFQNVSLEQRVIFVFLINMQWIIHSETDIQFLKEKIPYSNCLIKKMYRQSD